MLVVSGVCVFVYGQDSALPYTYVCMYRFGGTSTCAYYKRTQARGATRLAVCYVLHGDITSRWRG